MALPVAAKARRLAVVTGDATGPARSLYVHVPFCERKCSYCDFMSVGTTNGEAEYTEALRAELRLLSAALPETTFDTIFFGGGTPGLLSPPLMRAIMREVHDGFHIAPGAEITIEVNPSSTDEARAEQWLAAGFNRVSMGVQSLEPDILNFLDRVHDAPRALAAIDEVRSAGFDAVNCDLIYAVPGLDDVRWAATVDRILESDPGHLSCYELTVESGTPLHVAVARGTVRVVDPEVALRHHWIAVERAAAAGYTQYEISNFARPGRECRHNLVYWANGSYIAAGVGAHGNLPPSAAIALGLDAAEGSSSVRYWHGRSIPKYIEAARVGRFPVHGHESIAPEDAESERVMLGLRLNRGVTLAPRQLAEAATLAEAGLLVIDGTIARVTRRGQEVLNAVALRLCAA